MLFWHTDSISNIAQSLAAIQHAGNALTCWAVRTSGCPMKFFQRPALWYHLIDSDIDRATTAINNHVSCPYNITFLPSIILANLLLLNVICYSHFTNRKSLVLSLFIQLLACKTNLNLFIIINMQLVRRMNKQPCTSLHTLRLNYRWNLKSRLTLSRIYMRLRWKKNYWVKRKKNQTCATLQTLLTTTHIRKMYCCQIVHGNGF